MEGIIIDQCAIQVKNNCPDLHKIQNQIDLLLFFDFFHWGKLQLDPIKGLIPLLEFLYEKKLPMAIATSGIQVNIDFMFDHIPIRQFFPVIVNSSHIQKGKPDPEIYLQAAEKLKVETKHCLVFEDAVVGVKAAHRAGMRVIAVTSTHSREELSEAELVISDYTELL